MSDELGSVLSDEAPVVQVEEQVQTPVVEAEVQPEQTGEGVAATPAETQQEDPIQRHTKGLEAAVLAERRKRQELETQLEKLRNPPQQQAQQSETKPVPAQFETTEAYIEAVADWKATQAIAKHQERLDAQKHEQLQQEQAQVYAKRVNDMVSKGQVKYRDFDAVINSGLAPYLTPTLHQALTVGDGGHDVAYHLGKNTAEAMRLSQMPMLDAVYEIAVLTAKLKAAAPAVELPRTLTQQRDARGQYAQAVADGPTPLDAVLSRKT